MVLHLQAELLHLQAEVLHLQLWASAPNLLFCFSILPPHPWGHRCHHWHGHLVITCSRHRRPDNHTPPRPRRPLSPPAGQSHPGRRKRCCQKSPGCTQPGKVWMYSTSTFGIRISLFGLCIKLCQHQYAKVVWILLQKQWSHWQPAVWGLPSPRWGPAEQGKARWTGWIIIISISIRVVWWWVRRETVGEPLQREDFWGLWLQDLESKCPAMFTSQLPQTDVPAKGYAAWVRSRQSLPPWFHCFRFFVYLILQKRTLHNFVRIFSLSSNIKLIECCKGEAFESGQ